VKMRFINTFNGPIILRGNAPMDVTMGIPKFRAFPLTATLLAGQEASVVIPYSLRYFSDASGSLLYNFVFASATHLTIPLVGALKVVVETNDHSLCVVGKPQYDKLEIKAQTPYQVFQVSQLNVDSPFAIPHVIQAPDSPFPNIGLAWYDDPAGSGQKGLYLAFKTGATPPVVQGAVELRAYEDANMRIAAVGLVAGYTQYTAKISNYYHLTGGAVFRHDADHARWIMVRGSSAYLTVVAEASDDFIDIPANSPLFVMDVRRPTLLNRQKQILV